MNEVRQAYRKLLYDLYFSIDFKPTFLYSLVVQNSHGKISYGGKFPGAKRKLFVSDVDGVLNEKSSPSLFECYLKNHFNLKVRKDSEKLCDIARKIGEATRKGEKFEIENSVKELEKEMRNYNITLKEHINSCIATAKNFRPERKLIESFYEIKRLGYKIILNSGSPEDCLNFLVKVKSLPVDISFGSKWYFKDEKFFAIEPNLACKKLEVMERALEEEKDLFKKSVFITDDLSSDKEICLALGMAIKLGEREEIFHPFKIECNTIKDLVDVVKKWEILHIHYFTRHPRTELKIVEEVKNLKNSFDSLDKNNFIRALNEILRFAFPAYKDKIRKKAFDLKISKEKIKEKMSKILIEMEKYEPLIKAPYDKLEKFEERLREIVELWC